MKRMLRNVAVAVGAALFACVVLAEDQKPQSLDQLLDFVRQGQATDAREAREREARFAADKASQQAELDRAKALQAEQQQLSVALEKRFETNERTIAQRQSQLRARLGPLSELFGYLSAAAGDARAVFATSLAGAQFGDERVAKLDELVRLASSGEDLPSVEDLEGLWYELQREMVAAGTVQKFGAAVTLPDGNQAETEVVRIGVFNLVADDGRYLEYRADQGVLAVLPRQPGGELVDDAAELAAAAEGTHPFGVDPTGASGGSYLAALTAAPSFGERVHQGGLIGYLTMLLGVGGVSFAIYRLVVLAGTGARVTAQLDDPVARADNPLGRVLAVHQANTELDFETLELKLNEAVLREIPPIQSGLTVLKIIATVAPLLGLLGTVTGMIATFQAMTIFGAGDPAAMAGGVSQALVTTVQGLCVAIPVLLLHTVIGSRAGAIVQVLEEQAAGIIAERNEQAKG